MKILKLDTYDQWVTDTFGVDFSVYDKAGTGWPDPVNGNPKTTVPKPASGPTPTLYVRERGDGNEVGENDIHQGQIGDCFLLSSIGEIARIDPNVIKKMIQANGDGSYTVTLHRQHNGIKNLWGLFANDYEEVKVKVTPEFSPQSVNSGPNDDVRDGKKEIWPQLLEKAYMQVTGGQAAVTKGGRPENAMETLTGHDAGYVWAKDAKLDDIKQAFTSGKPIVMDTLNDNNGKTPLPFGLHGGHAYMVEGVDTGPDGKTYIRLKNPWGYDDPTPIPFDQMSKALQTVSTGSLQ